MNGKVVTKVIVGGQLPKDNLVPFFVISVKDLRIIFLLVA